LRTFTRVLADLGLNGAAAALHGAAHRPSTGPVPYGADSAMMQDTARTLLERLGQRDFDAHVTEGVGLTDDEVVTLALQALHRARHAEQSPALARHSPDRSPAMAPFGGDPPCGAG
jgi:hypothetical protein